jgi:hypothetical protein
MTYRPTEVPSVIWIPISRRDVLGPRPIEELEPAVNKTGAS